MTNPRIDASRFVQTILEEKVFFAELKKQAPEKDLPFINMLILTALRHWCAIQDILHLFLNKKIKNKQRIAHYMLSLAVAEILYMDTAVYAVIDETVSNIRKTTDKFLAGMANAVLRKVAIQKEKLRAQADHTFSLPDSFLEVLHDYTTDEINKIAQSVYITPPTDLTVKDKPQLLAEKLEAFILPNGSIRCKEIHKISSLMKTTDNIWIQDVAASLPVQIMGDIRGHKIVDLCAAPGGKTAQLAAAGAQVTALDISAFRIQKLHENLQRLHFDDVQILNTDALQFLQTTDEKFDDILLDAPCSATGTFRRHPEILHIKNINDVNAQISVQQQLLNNCTRVLHIGGTLVYSVCSICKDEGENLICNFLHDNHEWKLLPLSMEEIEKYGSWKQTFITDKGFIRTLPYYNQETGGMDSFFICKMQRII